MEVHRGEVFYADLSPVVGSEQGGIRPVLIIQNEIGNRHSPRSLRQPSQAARTRTACRRTSACGRTAAGWLRTASF